MAEAAHPHLFPSISGRKTELAVGLAAAGAAALFVSSSWTIVVAMGLLIFVLSAVENEAFLLLVIALLPLNWVFKTDLLVRDVMPIARLWVVVGFFFGRVYRGQLDLKAMLRPPLSKASFCFGAIALISVALAKGGWTHESERELFRLGSYLGFYLMMLAWIDSAARLRKIIRLLLVTTIVVSLFAILQELIGSYTPLWSFFNPADEYFIAWNGRATSFLAYPNVLAGYLNLVLPFALAFSVLGGERWKKLGKWTVALGLVAMLCTQSLGGFLAFGSVLLLAIIYFIGGSRKKLHAIAGLLVVVLGLYLLREVLNPAHAGSNLMYDSAGRLILWGTAWMVFLSSPILGVGWGNFVGSQATALNFASWMPSNALYANNLYLDFLAGAGLIGLAGFAIVAYSALREAHFAIRSSTEVFRRIVGFGVMGAVIASLIHGFVDDVIVVSPQAGTLFWMLLAFLTIVRRAPSSAPASREAWCFDDGGLTS